jgi:hypothetical protein
VCIPLYYKYIDKGVFIFYQVRPDQAPAEVAASASASSKLYKTWTTLKKYRK